MNTSHPADPAFSKALDDGRVRCDVCPHHCVLKEGERGKCFARMAKGGRVLYASYGGVSGFAVDPVEKKPLYHFLPGHRTLSFGTIGCNLHCTFCQNAHISQPVDTRALTESATPEQVVDLARRTGCPSVSFTYNEPIVSLEYTLDVAHACREAGLKTIAVTAGFIEGEARRAFFGAMDAANIDLKGFTDEFYVKQCDARLGPVLATLEYVARETKVWLEVTTLVIPRANDDPEELRKLAAWVKEKLGPDVPLHFTAFFPTHHMQDRPPTPVATLSRTREAALALGLKHVYSGNVRDHEGNLTRCPSCSTVLIEREGFEVMTDRLRAGGICPDCGTRIAGVFA